MRIPIMAGFLAAAVAGSVIGGVPPLTIRSRERGDEPRPDPPPEPPARAVYSRPIGPEDPTRSNASREKPEGRAAARRRRQMAKKSEASGDAC